MSDKMKLNLNPKMRQGRRVMSVIAVMICIVFASGTLAGCDIFKDGKKTTKTAKGTKKPGAKPKPTANPGDGSTAAPLATIGPVENQYTFSYPYSTLEGVFTFRGNGYRTGPSYGTANIVEKKLQKIWTATTPETINSWGGGSRWTGQPSLVKWPDDIKQKMNIKAKFKKDPDFVEVMIGSMTGRIYFFDLQTGEASRNPINTGSSIKGSVSVDPRGYPLLYTGQGLKDGSDGRFGFHIYNLYNQKELHFQPGSDSAAPRGWGAFDSSALFSRTKDELFVGGENGLLYKLNLNTKLDKKKGTISINPVIKKYNTYNRAIFGSRYGTLSGTNWIGIESSLVGYQERLFFSDNFGNICCFDSDLNLKWSFKNIDDSDSTMTLNVENGKPYLFSSNEVNQQGTSGICRVLKIDGTNGKTVWKKEFKVQSILGTDPSKGGTYASGIQGKGKISNLLILTICRTPSMTTGQIVALDKATGKLVWTYNMDTYAWPSPVDVYDAEGNAYIIQCDHNGNVLFIDGKTGKLLQKQSADTQKIEASPAVFGDVLVFATITGKVLGYKIK
ncbi:MAG: PQQ-binding-like beta-propeller repeat protein [Clostridia bacterium]